MRNSPEHPAGDNRVTTYFEFQARQVQRAEVALEVIDFDVDPPEAAIEVREQFFDSWNDLHKHLEQLA